MAKASLLKLVSHGKAYIEVKFNDSSVARGRLRRHLLWRTRSRSVFKSGDPGLNIRWIGTPPTASGS